jgi:hypothetical protein
VSFGFYASGGGFRLVDAGADADAGSSTYFRAAENIRLYVELAQNGRTMFEGSVGYDGYLDFTEVEGGAYDVSVWIDNAWELEQTPLHEIELELELEASWFESESYPDAGRDAGMPPWYEEDAGAMGPADAGIPPYEEDAGRMGAADAGVPME